MKTPIHILHIEDDLGTAELLRNQLMKFDCIVTIAINGETGLALFSTNKFDVILIDHTLPDITGLDVLRKIHFLPEFPPVTIMLTGTGDEQIAVDAMKAGADDYIIKDVAGTYIDLLIRVIHRAMEQRELRRNHDQLLIKQQQLIEELHAFSYAVAHDLKQPLTIMQSSLALLERFIAVHDAERTQQRLTQLTVTASKMNDTLEALMLFAHVRETTKVEFIPIDMRQMVLEVQHQFEDNIRQSQAIVTIQEDLPSALGYAPWIERIWINYFSNALKYGGTPPRIEIGASPNPFGFVSYWVKDNGDGLTQEELEKLFVPFSRLQEDRAEGHGLGLAIVNLVARKLGGEAWATSIVGNGSTFHFSLAAVDKP